MNLVLEEYSQAKTPVDVLGPVCIEHRRAQSPPKSRSERWMSIEIGTCR
jgi:hypothetical protein